MSNVSTTPLYPARYPQQQNNDGANNQAPPRALTAPYTANVFGGELKYQPIPTFSFSPSTTATIAAKVTTPIGLSVGVGATARFQPEISIGPNDAGGVKVAIVPKMRLELSGNVSVGVPSILGSDIGVNAGGSLAKWVEFSAPEFSVNLNPEGVLNINANLNPTLTLTQRAALNGGVQANVANSGVGAGAGVDQSLVHQTQQQIRLGGPGVKFEMLPGSRPQITTNLDGTVSISNSYSFVPKTSVSGNVQAGPVSFNAGGGVTPGVTVKYTMTLSTDLSSKIPPKTNVTISSGVLVDAYLGLKVSLFPKEWPVKVEAGVAFHPSASASTSGGVTV